MEHYKSRTNNFFHFSNPHDDDDLWSEISESEGSSDGDDDDGSYDYYFHPYYRTLLDSGRTPNLPPDIQNCGLMNSMDTPNVSRKQLRTLNDGELISEIDRTAKKLSVNLLCAIDDLSARILQLDGKTCRLDNAVDDLTNSADHHHAKVDGKLTQLQNILHEVQDSVLFLKDKHEIAEAQLQVAKLGSQRSQSQRSVIQPDYVHQVSLSASVQSYDRRHAVEAQLQGQLAQNQTPTPQSISSYYPAWQTTNTAFQQFLPSTQSESPQLLHSSPTHLLSPMHSLPVVVTTSNHSLLGHHPEEKNHMPSYSYFSSSYQSPSHPAGWGPSKEFDGSELQMYGHPLGILHSPRVYNLGEMHPNNNLPSYPDGSTIKPFPFSSNPCVIDHGSNYVRLPTANILPHALPFATSVEAVVDSLGNSNSDHVDDVIEKVTAMGFQRDLIKATVRKLMENGQSLDLNVVLDLVMNP